MTDLSNPEKLPLGELPYKTVLAMMEAAARGKKVEIPKVQSERWLVAESPQWHPLVAYRIAPDAIYPSVNWDHVHPDINHIARDMHGELWAFNQRPSRETKAWGDGGTCCYVVMSSSGPCILASYDPGTCDWQDSLISRPGVE